jgi:hypothetical protein
MPKSPKKSPVKRASKAVKPKMMMTDSRAFGLYWMVSRIRHDLNTCKYLVPSGSKEAAALAKRMISCADALYKAAGVK